MRISEIDNNRLLQNLKKLSSKEEAMEVIYKKVKEGGISLDQMDHLIIDVWSHFSYIDPKDYL